MPYLIFNHIHTFIQVGTMYLTGSHPEKLKVEGPALMTAIDTALREAQLRDRVYICGIGGITPTNCEAVLRAGADGVAVISGIAAVDDNVPRTVAAFREVFASLDGVSENGGGACL
jgi:thiamine-phosphate pyrophosphorylase